MTAASTSASDAIVRFWRRMNASAPSLMASEMAFMAGVPVSRRRTHPARPQATTSAPAEHKKMIGISQVMLCSSRNEPARAGPSTLLVRNRDSADGDGLHDDADL